MPVDSFPSCLVQNMKSEPLTQKELKEIVAGLNKMARNLWWTWNNEAQEIFETLSPRTWQNQYHNAVAVLREVSEWNAYELRVRLQDPCFAAKVKAVLKKFDDYMGRQDTWAAANAPQLLNNPVAYFSAEFGFHESLPIAAGGLGMLAGDHTKSASDLGLGFVGITLFYRDGYFQQTINHENWQVEYYPQLNPRNLAMEPVLKSDGDPLLCEVDIMGQPVFFRTWKTMVGRSTLFLLDTNVEQNPGNLREITARVYGGDVTTRIMQEIVLGIGGVKLLRYLGINPSVFHMNEGHSAFLVLELIREQVMMGKTFEEGLKEAIAHAVFTTHTPVPAGHDRFNEGLVRYALGNYASNLKVPFSKVMGLGRVNPEDNDELFCMTVLALKGSRSANGVSELHGQVSRKMWKDLYPGKKEEEVPIGHITNGVHLAGWMKGCVAKFYENKLGAEWQELIYEPETWKNFLDEDFVTDEEIWALRYQLRRELIEFARRRLLAQGKNMARDSFVEFDRLLDPNALTIGFARRFATYKRAVLIFERFNEIVKLVKDPVRPVQFIFAGKAHPRDDEGKRYIQNIIHQSKYSELAGRLVFLENYDVHVARQMVSGCDVWLNNPRRPLEASGTSGQKTCVNGCLNLSILDGWWREGYDGTNGFAIGEDSNPDDVKEQDRIDSENLFRTLTEQVVPEFFDRSANGIPKLWIKRIRRNFATLPGQFNTSRMVKEYVQKYYLNGGK